MADSDVPISVDNQGNQLENLNGSLSILSDEYASKNTSPIYKLSKNCLDRYQALCDALSNSTLGHADDIGFDQDASLFAIRDAEMMFKAWAANMGALQSAKFQSSLDNRLSEATKIRERIFKILKDLVESLNTASLIVSGVEPNEKWQVGAISDLEDEDSTVGDEAPKTSELDELLSAIIAANPSLVKLSMIIRTSPTRDDYLKAATRYHHYDTRWDVGHVKEKHGSAKRSSDWLVERMGKAITWRRRYLKYREEHNEKLSRDWDIPQAAEEKTVALTKATTYVEQPAVREKPEDEDSLGSQTSYEPTVMGESTEKLTVPPPPTFAFKGVPFEFKKPFLCPLCYTEQNVKNKAAWKKHVFRDLKPYVCTFKDCDLKMFRSRNKWFAHELQSHRREWACPFCSQTHKKKGSFIGHLQSAHNSTPTGTQLEALILQSEEPIDKIPASACSFCDDWEFRILHHKQNEKSLFLNNGAMIEPYGTLTQFRRHVGRLMEQLALFSLPVNEGDNIGDDSAEEEDQISVDSEETAASEKKHREEVEAVIAKDITDAKEREAAAAFDYIWENGAKLERLPPVPGKFPAFRDPIDKRNIEPPKREEEMEVAGTATKTPKLKDEAVKSSAKSSIEETTAPEGYGGDSSRGDGEFFSATGNLRT